MKAKTVLAPKALFALSLILVAAVLLLFFREKVLYFYEKPAPLEVTFALPEHPPAAPLFVAAAEGFFAKHGIQPKFVRFPSGARALSAMLSGDADMASAADVPIAAAGLERSDFRVVAMAARADSDARIVARRDSGILTPKDLAGKRIGTQKLSAVHYFLHSFLLRHGVANIQESFFKAEDLVGALSDGRIDAFAMREPFVGQAKTALGEKIVVFDAPNLYVRGEYIVARTAFLERGGEAVRRLLMALIDAEKFMRKNRERSMAFVARELKSDPGGIAAVWPEMEVDVSLGRATLTQFEAEGAWAMRYMEKSNSLSIPNYMTLVEPRFLEEIDAKRVILAR